MAKNGVITTGVCESIETLRKNGELHVKCSQNGFSSIKRAPKQQKLEFWTREEQNFCSSKMSSRARTHNKKGEEMFNKKPRKTHARQKNIEAGRTKRCRKRVAGRRVSQLAETTVAPSSRSLHLKS